MLVRNVLRATCLLLAVWAPSVRAQAPATTAGKAATASTGQQRTSTPSAAALIKQANAAREAGDLERAIELYRRIVTVAPGQREAWWYSGTSLYELERWDEARLAFDRVVGLDKANAPALAFRGLTIFGYRLMAVSLLGTGARPPTVAFLGWFGPRGAASIVFALLVVEEGGLPGDELLLATAFVTVGLSVLLHGVTAAPLATGYADWLGRHPRDDVEVEAGAGAPGLRWRLAQEEGEA